MSLITTSNELQHLLMAHHVESHFTPMLLAQFQATFKGQDDTASIPFSQFTKVFANVVSTMPVELQMMYDEAEYKSWFAEMDEDFDGLISLKQVIGALAIASTMRRHQTKLIDKIISSKWNGPVCEKIVWIPNWRRIVFCSSSSAELKLLSSTGTPQSTLQAHVSATLAAAYLPALSLLCTTGCDRKAIMWDSRYSTPVASTVLDCPASAIVHEPDSNLVFFALLDGSLVGYKPDLKGAPVVRSKAKHDDWIKDIVFIPEVHEIVTASLDKTIGVWKPDGSLVMKRTGHSRTVTCLAYMAHAKKLFSAGQGREILCWNPFSVLPAPLASLVGHDHPIVGLFADCINQSLISVDSTTRVVVWDAGSFVPLQAIDGGEATVHHLPVKSACQNPVTREIYFMSDHFYRVSAPVSALRPPKFGETIKFLHYSEDTRHFVATADEAVYIFDAVTGLQVRVLQHPFAPHITHTVEHACYAGRGIMFFSAKEDARVVVAQIDKGSSANPRKPVVKRLISILKDGGIVHAAFARKDKADMNVVLRSGICAHNTVDMYQPGEIRLILQHQHEIATPVHHVSQDSTGERCCIVHGQEGTVTVWEVKKRLMMPLTLPDSGPGRPLQSVFVPSRNALAVITSSSISIFNVGSFVHVAECEVDLEPVMLRPTSITDGAAAGAGPEENSSEDGNDAEMMDVELTAVGVAEPDALVCLTNVEGKAVRLDILNVVASFFSIQPKSIVDSEMPDETRLHNHHYAIDDPRPKEGPESVISKGYDARTHEPIMLKAFETATTYEKEIAVREALGETPFVIGKLAEWADNRDLPKGTAKRAVVLEGGEAELKDYIRPNPSQYTTPSLTILTREEEKRVLSAVERRDAVMSVLHALAFIHEKGFVVSDLRPRGIVRVGEVWKLCGLNTFVKMGDAALARGSAAYIPPELGDHLLHRKRTPIPAEYSMNMWPLALIALELYRGAKTFGGEVPNEETIVESVMNIPALEIEKFKRATQTDPFTHTIVSMCLQPEPSQRATAKEVIEALGDLGYTFDVNSKFARASCHAGSDRNPLPAAIAKSAMCYRTTILQQNGELPLDRVHVASHLAGDWQNRLMLVADKNMLDGGRGNFHLLTNFGKSMGLVPEPEIGRDETCVWRWPLQHEVEQRREAAENERIMKSGDVIGSRDQSKAGGGKGGGGSQPQKPQDGGTASLEDPRDKIAVTNYTKEDILNHNKYVVRTSRRFEELQPPEGWKQMTDAEIEASLDAASPERLQTSTEDFVNGFVSDTLRRAPFFRGGALNGDELPVYSKDPLDRLSDLTRAQISFQKGQAYYARKREKLQRTIASGAVENTRPIEKFGRVVEPAKGDVTDHPGQSGSPSVYMDDSPLNPKSRFALTPNYLRSTPMTDSEFSTSVKKKSADAAAALKGKKAVRTLPTAKVLERDSANLMMSPERLRQGFSNELAEHDAQETLGITSPSALESIHRAEARSHRLSVSPLPRTNNRRSQSSFSVSPLHQPDFSSGSRFTMSGSPVSALKQQRIRESPRKPQARFL